MFVDTGKDTGAGGLDAIQYGGYIGIRQRIVGGAQAAQGVLALLQKFICRTVAGDGGGCFVRDKRDFFGDLLFGNESSA